MWALCSILAPLGLFTLWVVLSHWLTRTNDFSGILIAGFIGFWPITRLSISTFGRVALCFCYLAVAAILLFVYGTFFVCAAFHDCL
jgi:hypothetical protein